MIRVKNGTAAILLLAGSLGAMQASLAQDSAAYGRDLLLEATLEPAQVLVQAQAIYRLRFYQAVDVRDLKITGPSALLADIQPIDEGHIYEALRDGKRYRVHERSYAVFPFSSGPLELAGAHATGRIITLSAASGNGRKNMHLDAASQRLKVLPASNGVGVVPWLPATSVKISETWSPSTDHTHVGEAQQRTIRVEATGVHAEQIPELHITTPDMSVHAGPPRFENRFVDERKVGTREQTFSMVPLRAGEIVVPELQLHWWNSKAEATASATLPARTLRVTAATDALSTPPPAPPHWSRSLLIVVSLLAATVAAYRRRVGMLAAWRLHRRCRHGDARAARDGLLAWSTRAWPTTPPTTLQALAERLDDPGARFALHEIERSLYGPAAAKHNARSLNDAVRQVKRGVRRAMRRRKCVVIRAD